MTRLRRLRRAKRRPEIDHCGLSELQAAQLMMGCCTDMDAEGMLDKIRDYYWTNKRNILRQFAHHPGRRPYIWWRCEHPEQSLDDNEQEEA